MTDDHNQTLTSRSWLSALDALPAHIVVLNRDGSIIAANHAWRAFAPETRLQSPDDCIGANYLAVCDAAPATEYGAHAVSTAIRDAAAGATTPFECRYPCEGDGEVYWFLVRVVGFVDGGERLVMVSHENITPMVQAEVARDRADGARDEFLGLMSHELRTPLTTIYGNARILRDRGDAIGRERGAEAMADVESEAVKLQRLVDNMLSLSRVGPDHDVPFEPMLVRRAIDHAVNRWQRVNPLRSFLVSVEDQLPPMNADGQAAELVLDNLISNACENSAPDTQIEIDAYLERDCVAVSVSDRGAGLEPGEEEAIFEPFRKGERKGAFAAGVGIGLTACKRLVESMRGAIWASRRDGGGTRVTFTLPAATE